MKLDHALALAAQGFKVFPIAAGKKAPPLLNGWPQKATSDPKEVELLWVAVPNANIGVHCEGMLVIDVDPKRSGNESLDFLQITDGLPDTRVAVTPTGGRHLYFRCASPVGNSVDVLGRGLDVRAAGGYVVAPGSEIAGLGVYAWENDLPVAMAPEYLTQRLRTDLRPRDGVAARPAVESAPISVLGRAREWLASQAPAIEGQGGDARTFAVACGLRDQGVSKAQALELMALWNENCAPPWEPHDLAVKVANAYRYAENEAGSKAALPSDFPLVENAQHIVHSPPTRKPEGAQTLAEFAGLDTPGSGYVVKGVLQRASYAEIYGAPGEGKTFVALDMAYHVSAGLAWMNHKVHPGVVLYLAYEGQGGLRKRAKALRQKYGAGDVPLYIAGAAYDLRAKPGREALGALIATLPAKPVLIVIDTLARALSVSGGDENSSQDVGSFNSGVAALIEHTGACVLLIHHSGKDKSKGARGSSALLGAIDTEIEIVDHQIIARKQRDVELAPPIGFKLVPLMVGIDEDGDDVTSCVVESGPALSSGEHLKPRAVRALQTLEEMSPSNKPVTLGAWEAQVKKDRGIARSSFYLAKDELVRAGRVVKDDEGLFTRKLA